MINTRTAKHDLLHEDISIPSFGYELIREELITNILGKDAPEILYWSGKQLARTYPLQSLPEISAFFEETGWGHLILKKQTKNEYLFELSSALIKKRLQLNTHSHFKLEAGFLAQQTETQNGMITEAFEEVNKKTGHIEIIVRWDQQDLIK